MIRIPALSFHAWPCSTRQIRPTTPRESWLFGWLSVVALIIVGCSSPAAETSSVPLDVPPALAASLSGARTPATDVEQPDDGPADSDARSLTQSTLTQSTPAQSTPAESTPAERETPPPASTATAVAEATPAPPVAPNPFIDQISSLPPAPQGLDALVGDPDPQPVRLRIDRLDIVAATVIDVGVNEDETFEVPPADEVGWYRFGPSPGQAGSAVLAAHIAFDGVDGVFRHLEDLKPGDRVEVSYDDGSTSAFVVESITEYDKQSLPDELFAKDGPAKLALITCGGAFNRQLRSYESNTVAIAKPL